MSIIILIFAENNTTMKEFDMDKTYKAVIDGLENGIPIYKTLRRIGLNSHYFYKALTKQQYLEMNLVRHSTKMFSCYLNGTSFGSKLGNVANIAYLCE